MRRQKGFTWIELLIVVAIIGVFAAVVIPFAVGLLPRHSSANDTISSSCSVIFFRDDISGKEWTSGDCGKTWKALPLPTWEYGNETCYSRPTPTPTPISTPCSEWIEGDIYTADTYSGITLKGNLTDLSSGNETRSFLWGWNWETTSHAIPPPTPCCPQLGEGWSLPAPTPEPTPEPACSSITITLRNQDYDFCDFIYTGCRTHRWNEKYPFDDFVHSPCLATLGYDLTSAPWGCPNKDDQYRIYYPKSPAGFGELYVGRETFFYIAFHFNTSQFFFNSETCTEALIWDIQVPQGWEIQWVEWDEYTHFYQWE